MNAEVLAVGAHPDDVEVGIGALVHKLTTAGRAAAILDLTRGEMGSRGSVEERKVEADEAADVLGVATRVNADLPDGGVANTAEQRRPVVEAIRRIRPRVLFLPMADDRHPDHHAAHRLVRDAAYFAGLIRIETDAPPHRPERIYFYRVYGEDAMPQMIVNVEKHFEAKMAALRCFRSQFHNPAYDGPETFIATREFLESIRTRAAWFGSRIGAAYGEALYVDGPLSVDLPPGLERTP